MIGSMTAILYPVARNADQALAAPMGRAARERDAARMADEEVVFVTEPAGPAFATREAALDAFAGRVEDERPGRGGGPAPEDRYCRLAETVLTDSRPPPPAKPVYAEGRRWPAAPPKRPHTAWRLQVSYWRAAAAGQAGEHAQARRARRRGAAARLDPDTLRAMAHQPLRPVEPQQPLDIGLFEARLPESPHIIVPDE
jgi:hypothetical protein